MHLVKNKDQRPTPVNTVMFHEVTLNGGGILIEWLLPSQVELCPMV